MTVPISHKLAAMIARSTIRCDPPASGAHYWIYCPLTSTLTGALGLAESLGLEWRHDGEDGAVVTFIGGELDGEVDILDFDEIPRKPSQDSRILFSWMGLEFPLLAMWSPGFGVELNIEFLRRREFQLLHRHVTEDVLPKTVDSRSSRGAIVVGVDSCGHVEFPMHSLFSAPRSVPLTTRKTPDFLVLSGELWGPMALDLDETQSLQQVEDLTVLTTNRARGGEERLSAQAATSP